MFDDMQTLSDLDLIKREFADYHPSRDQAVEPVYFTTASWFALHEWVHYDGEDGVEFIRATDLIKDTSHDHEDTRHVFGFPDTEDGIEALKTLYGWLGLNAVYKRDPKTGTFQECSMFEPPKLTQKCVKVAAQKALKRMSL